ncbi:MAG: SRPBCC family protein [Myxococcaceae bacterium]
MRFEQKQRINGTIAEIEAALFDDRYLEFLLKHHGVLLEVQLLEKKDEGDKVRRKVRYRPRPVIKSIGPKTVPPEWFAFIETSTYDKARHELSFSNVPTTGQISKMLVNTGTLRLKDVGGGQTERTMEGEIALKLPFFLKPLGMIGERVIHSEGMKILDAEPPVLNRFIAEVVRAK